MIIVSIIFITSACTNSTEQLSSQEQSAKALVDSYLTAIKENNADLAYSYIHPASKVNKDDFYSSLDHSPLSQFEILETKKIDDTSAKVKTLLTVNELDNAIVFLVQNTGDNWQVVLQTEEETKENLEF